MCNFDISKFPTMDQSNKKNNELNKNKEEQQFEADFFLPDNNSELTPELEEKYLSFIQECEKESKKAECKTVHEIIGGVFFVKEDAIPNNKIGEALDQVMNTLNKSNICVESIHEVEERDLYKFITEELLKYKIYAIQGEGMFWHFVYEDFHPNHEFDIARNCKDFIISFLDTKDNTYKNYLTFESEYNKNLFSFKNSFDSFELAHMAIENISYDEALALVEYSAEIYGKFDDTCEAQLFTGKGSVALVYEDDFWYIYWVKFPGVEV